MEAIIKKLIQCNTKDVKSEVEKAKKKLWNGQDLVSANYNKGKSYQGFEGVLTLKIREKL